MPYTPGPYDSTHLYLQWGGKLPGGEQWSNGLRFAGPAASAEADANAMLVGAAAAVVAFHQRATTYISNGALLSFVKLNPIDVNGHYIGDGTVQALYADLPGGVAGIIYPNQVTLAVTMTTGFSRGPAHKGRIYLPLPNIPMQADGTITSATAGNVGTSTDTLRTALDGLNANWKLNVFSRKLGAPAHRPITGNIVGRVLDTQRRRRRSLPELYV